MEADELAPNIKEYKQIFYDMAEEFKWTDKKVLMLAASVYVMHDQRFSPRQFKELCEYIKKESGLFSPLKSDLRFTVAALLDVHGEAPKEKYDKLHHVYDKLVEHGFKKGNFTYIAALIILTGERLQAEDDQMNRALTIYKEMKNEHPFLTAKEDYPLAFLLSKTDGEVKDVVNRVEFFYKKLSQDVFRKGNDLQFLSHILSLDEEHENERLVERAGHIYDQMKHLSIKPKTVHYPEIGLLSLFNEGTKELETIKAVKKDLDQSKHFKWNKDINFKMAVNLSVSHRLKDSSIAATGLFTTIESIMQAQQAAMMAGMVGAVAASNTTNT
ncbi:hypothetical protein GCM10010954_03920 [Halobacillus andaensis]|uniref:DUF4003 domain-containing protein n=1 Tax=Halobacillus andaensis TaxID=1176239 RepID=A0A917AXX6_HALAA|nr:DUF4003 family protein [Halobacillus andaensis]MBP2003182.1 hypothetical protein [Halobacillus andaensis]GGF08631.1 hypothetical protein GCM10010954_03920 [Halobacillus andaensis]